MYAFRKFRPLKPSVWYTSPGLTIENVHYTRKVCARVLRDNIKNQIILMKKNDMLWFFNTEGECLQRGNN